jgi:DNA-binding XRE family transcriptional regulator
MRRERDWSQQHIADIAGITKSAVSQIEVGKIVPAIETIMNIGSAFEDPSAIYCYPPTVLWSFTPVIEKIKGTYSINSLDKDAGATSNARDFFLKSLFIDKVRLFFDALSIESKMALFPDSPDDIFDHVPVFLDTLPNCALIAAFGNRTLLLAQGGDYRITGWDSLDVRESPLLDFEHIAPVLCKTLGVELKRRDTIDAQRDEMISILHECPDIVQMLHPVISRLHNTRKN